MKRAVSTGGDAPAAGPITRRAIGEDVIHGNTEFVGRHTPGGKEIKGTETYDDRSVTFRKLNNTDGGPKNG